MSSVGLDRLAGEKWVILGDFNAHIGLLGEEVNVNGRIVRDWLIENEDMRS